MSADKSEMRNPPPVVLVRGPIRARMVARSIDEPHRTSSQLELLFDLTFVIAIANVTEQLARRIAEGSVVDGVVPFLQVFFAIWWAWMNFTWFASSYDTDDVRYRLLTLVQMAGVLVLAAGVPPAANDHDYRAVTVGYFIMRIGLVWQWIRAGIEDPASRVTCRRYVVGISIAELGWLLRLLLDESGVLPRATLLPIFAILVLLELAIPWWSERARRTTWHPHHIAERYGLFTIILLGESVSAASTGVAAVLRDGRVTAALVTMAVAGLVLLFALWWLYFLEPCGKGLANRRDRSFLWGYGHYGIFAALAALGGGLEVAVEHAGHTVQLSPFVVSYGVAVPVSVFLVLLCGVNARVVPRLAIRPAATLGGALVILFLPATAGVTNPAVVVAGIATTSAVIVAFTVASPRLCVDQ
jgi:low temperature requirement protein LtrA